MRSKKLFLIAYHPYSSRIPSESITLLRYHCQNSTSINLSDLKNPSVILSQEFYYTYHHSHQHQSDSIASQPLWSTTPRILLNWQVLLLTREVDNIHGWLLLYVMTHACQCCANPPSSLSSMSSTWETAALYFPKWVHVMASGFLRLQPCTWATPCKQSQGQRWLTGHALGVAKR